jgi:hypothetical protein
MRSASKKVLVVSTALGVVALGTGVSLAATQGSAKAQSVTCILVVDASAAADANTALSDVFAVGTNLHMTSAGRAVDVTVSGPITAAAPSASATADPSDSATADPSASATADPSDSATADPSASATADPSDSATADPSASATADPSDSATVSPSDSATAAPSDSASAPASTPAGGGTGSKGGHKKGHHRKPAQGKAAQGKAAQGKAAQGKAAQGKAAQGDAAKKATADASTSKAVNSLKAAQAGDALATGKNGGVDPNTVCAELSKNAFNTLGASGNGANVGAFIATMTTEAALPSGADPSAAASK